MDTKDILNEKNVFSKKELDTLVRHASYRWRESFNAGDAEGCASNYLEDAVMHAIPFGTFTGISQIKQFWQKLINDGYTDVEYQNIMITSTQENQIILTANWTMNKAKGVIHKELWVPSSNTSLKLLEDSFEVTG